MAVNVLRCYIPLVFGYVIVNTIGQIHNTLCYESQVRISATLSSHRQTCCVFVWVHVQMRGMCGSLYALLCIHFRGLVIANRSDSLITVSWLTFCFLLGRSRVQIRTSAALNPLFFSWVRSGPPDKCRRSEIN